MRDLSKIENSTGLDELYELASGLGVEIYGFSLPQCRAVSCMDTNGRCCIGLDNSRSYSESEEKTMLAHELGHCSTGSFYNEYSPLSLRSKCEQKADEWAILKCVPYEQLINACRSGINSGYELAEHFGVSESFIHKAIKYYIQRRNQDGSDGKDNNA